VVARANRVNNHPATEPEVGDGYVHVYPLFGREHEMSVECWCHPDQHPEEPTLYVHHVEN